MQNEEVKVGLSKLELTLSIIGIIFFSLFIILPPIFRVVFKEDDPVIEPPVVVDVEKTISCSREVQDIGVYQNYQYTIVGVNDNLTRIFYTENFKYDELLEDITLECNTLNSTYSNLDGLYYNCGVLENEKTIDVRITLPMYQGSVIENILNYQGETLSTYHEKLIGLGFTCGEIKED